MKKIFISRKLSEESKKVLNSAIDLDHVTDDSLLDIHPLKLDHLPLEKVLFFSSKNGVKYFFGQVAEKHWKNWQYACVGAKTAQALHALNIAAEMVGDGNPEHVVPEILKRYQTGQMAFISGKKFAGTIEKLLLKEGFVGKRYFVYDQSKKSIRFEDQFDVLAFTSPMNFEAFLEVNSIASSTKVLTIGNSTRQAIRHKIPDHDILVSDETTEESLCQLIVKLVREK